MWSNGRIQLWRPRPALWGVLLEENELQLSSLRRDNLKWGGRRILKLIGGEVKQLFINFSTRLATAARSTFRSYTIYSSSATKGEKLWSAFHQLRLSELPTLWKDFLSSIWSWLQWPTIATICEPKTSRKSYLSTFHLQPIQVLVMKSQLNALQHACGYIPHALLKRYEKSTGSKFDKFIECLGDMAVRSECNSENFLHYTKEWIDKVNRRGLFPLKDTTYLFLSVEKSRYYPWVIWRRLKCLQTPSSEM